MTRAGLEARVIKALVSEGQTIAIAESLTGGQLVSRLIDVPGASAAVRGGIVAYQNTVKADRLGLDLSDLNQFGAVRESVALQMARSVRGALENQVRADYGVATTGVAGPDPDPHTGAPAGQAYVAVVGPDDRTWTRTLSLAGTRADIRLATIEAALELLATALGISDRE